MLKAGARLLSKSKSNVGCQSGARQAPAPAPHWNITAALLNAESGCPSFVKAERPAPSAQRHTTATLLNEKRVPVFFSLKENVEVRPAPSAQRHTTATLLNEKRVPVFFSLKENVEVEVETVARPSATLEHHSRPAGAWRARLRR